MYRGNSIATRVSCWDALLVFSHGLLSFCFSRASISAHQPIVAESNSVKKPTPLEETARSHRARSSRQHPLSQLLILGSKLLELLGGPGQDLGGVLAVADLIVVQPLAVTGRALRERAAFDFFRGHPASTWSRDAIQGMLRAQSAEVV